MKSSTTVQLMTLALVAAACSSSPGVGVSDSAPNSTTAPPTTEPGGTPGPGEGGGVGPVGFAPAPLQQFDDCATFLDHVRGEAAERVGPYGFGTGWHGPIDMFALEDAAAVDEVAASNGAPAATAPGSRAAGGDDTGGDGGAVSGTNVQVEGVDEPDIVKTDGDRVLAVANGVLHYIDIDPDGSGGTWRGSIALHELGTSYGFGHEIFVVGDRAFVFTQNDVFYGGHPIPMPVDDVVAAPPVEETVDGTVDAEEEFATPPADEVEPLPPVIVPDRGDEGPSLSIVEVDLTNPADLRVRNTMTIEGRYVSARATGTTARVVVTSPPDDLGFVYPSHPGSEDVAERTNREIVLASTVEDWVPTFALSGPAGTTSGQLAACGDIHAPAEFSGFEMLSIVTLDLGAELAAPTGTSSVMASGETVYASQDRLYVSTNKWNPWPTEQLDRPDRWPEEHYETAIHRFSIAGAGPAAYEASGAVAGHLLNQFSMNDRDGVLYAATTEGAPWTESSVSQIVALERNGDRLEPIGVVGGMGLGERIFSVRYVGELAYVVTFRQTDPFYVVDLTDPRAMRVAGELKIPGFSSYLHPIGERLVLGVGQDATDQGRVTGAKVSLFDVSDPADPIEVDVWTMPNSSSIAEFDHRAFLYWAPTNTVVLPLQSHGDRFAGAIVFDVSADGIVERGRITHSDADDGPVGRTDCEIVDVGDLGPDTELFWIGQEGGQVQLCGATDAGGATGLFCETIPVDEAQYFWEGSSEIDLTGVDRMELCWPDWNGYQVAVQRTMVIDGSVWTLSRERLQANDLDTLSRTAAIAL